MVISTSAQCRIRKME